MARSPPRAAGQERLAALFRASHPPFPRRLRRGQRERCARLEHGEPLRSDSEHERGIPHAEASQPVAGEGARRGTSTCEPVADPLVPVLPDKMRRGWPKNERGGRVRYIRLSQLLGREFRSDAHFAAYSVPSKERRLTNEALAQLPDGVPMPLLVIDVDCPDSHASSGGKKSMAAPDSWWVGERCKIERLRAIHPDGYGYRTRGGYRIVYRLSEPLVLTRPSDKERWALHYRTVLHYLKRSFGIDGDGACAQWFHLFRAPHATREAGHGPERLEVIGDRRRVGLWRFEPTAADLDAGRQSMPAKRRRSRSRRSSRPMRAQTNWAPSRPFVLAELFRARGWLGRVFDPSAPGKFAVRCPWAGEHTKGEDYDTSTVVFPPPDDGVLGYFHCSHAHCARRTPSQVLSQFTEAERDTAEFVAARGRERSPVGGFRTDQLLGPRQKLDLRDPSTRDELVETAGQICSEATPEQLLVWASTPGSGKSYALVLGAALASAAGRSVAYLVRDHLLAATLAQQLRELIDAGLAPVVEVVHRRGLASICEEPDTGRPGDRLLQIGDRRGREELRQLLALGRAQGACGGGRSEGDPERCPEFDRCPAKTPTRLGPRRVVFAAVDAARALVPDAGAVDPDAAELLQAAGQATTPLLIVDELPPTVRSKAVSTAALRSLVCTSTARRSWLYENALLGEIADAVACALDRAGNAHASSRDEDGRAPRYPVSVWGEELEALMRNDPAIQQAVDKFVEDAKRGGHSGPLSFTERDLPAPPNRRDVRAGRAPGPRPSREACALLHSIVRVAAWEAKAVSLGLEAKLSANGSAQLEAYEVASLPPSAAVVLADGTAELSAREYEDWASAMGRRLSVHATDVVGGRPEAAVAFVSKQLTTRNLLVPSGDGHPGLATDAPATLKNLLHLGMDEFAARGCLTLSAVIGLLVNRKAVADALRVANGDVVENPSFSGSRRELATLTECLQGLRSIGFRFVIGHVGLHDRGSRAFEDVDAFIQLGDPVDNIGVTHAHARALAHAAGRTPTEIDCTELVRARGESKRGQGSARPRWLRAHPGGQRAPVAVGHVGAGYPPDVVAPWTFVEGTGGQPRSLERISASVRAAEFAAQHQAITNVAWKAGELGLSQPTVRKVVEAIAAARGWRRFHIPAPRGGRWTIFAETEARAHALAERLRGR